MHKKTRGLALSTSKGFTLVELIIVIVIIGILAAVTVVGYTSQTSKARDVVRKYDLGEIYKALRVRNIELGTFIVTGYGSVGLGSGYFNLPYNNGGAYPSVCQGLIDGGFLPREIKDPETSRPVAKGYMINRSTDGRLVSLYATLENITDVTPADGIDDTSSPGANPGYLVPTPGYSSNYRVGNGF